MRKILLISLLTGTILSVSLLYFFNPASSGIFPPCPFHTITGLYCPGCGSLRALHNLLHLNLPGVTANNILVIPVIILIFYHIIWSIFKPARTNILYHKYTPLLIFFIIIIFWILRNIPVYPFILLSPS
ncbi:MAG: DUF2752 domain-containing protein [Bacteroidales bacterium]|nr:DUF2752 domain-containing protein [Bacteroidales bacterium]